MNTYTHTFQKTISGNQVCALSQLAGCWQAPGLKIIIRHLRINTQIIHGNTTFSKKNQSKTIIMLSPIGGMCPVVGSGRHSDK